MWMECAYSGCAMEWLRVVISVGATVEKGGGDKGSISEKVTEVRKFVPSGRLVFMCPCS